MRVTKKLIKENPVKAAAEMAQATESTISPEEAKAELVKIRKELAKLQSVRADLLPIEASENNKTVRKIGKLKEKEEMLARATLPAIITMPIFDTECLNWRDENGFPRLVPFSIDDPKFTIGFSAKVYWRDCRYTKVVGPKLSNNLAKHYEDVLKTLRKQRKPKTGISISTRFSGAIPDHIRDLARAGSYVFKETYIIAEVQDWTISHKKPTPVPTIQGDPLLVGFDGKNYRLVASFDVTTVEQIAIDRSKGKRPS